uniref:WD repeat-containing protein 5-like n=1 Tax=Crassostrea virginica TaxID=6565 RepID=A0A8B8CIX0_CRAVI|nr:WD repeat-containing protein 5-like [Crassostrea virginica]XP_022315771.1 WD repeat-containing protein 5-like [Crassostrea virginica]XP_022315772.1 WD repeat-containing protein 5-like [Crassostrea virginica]
MARRRQEALEAGQMIEKGKNWPEKFTKIETIKEIPFDPALGHIYSLQYSYNGELLAVGHENGAIMLYSSTTGKLVMELRKSRYGGMAIMCMRFHPKAHHILLATTSDGKIFSCNTNTGDIEEFVSEIGNEINCLDFDFDGLNFATGGRDLNIRIYNSKTGQLVHTYEGYSEKQNPTEIQTAGCAMRVFALKYHPEYDDIFVTGGWENHLKIWDARSNDGVKRTIHGPHICGDSLDLKEMKILTGSWVATHSLQVWNYTEGKLEKDVPFDYKGHDGAYLYCAQFCDNDVVVAGGSGTNNVQAINTVTGEVIGKVQMHKPVQALDTVLGGRLLAVGGGENNLVLAALK